jgi:hypothetical protein
VNPYQTFLDDFIEGLVHKLEARDLASPEGVAKFAVHALFPEAYANPEALRQRVAELLPIVELHLAGERALRGNSAR